MYCLFSQGSSNCPSTSSARPFFSIGAERPSIWDHICKAIKGRQYKIAFRDLYAATPTTKRHYIDRVGKTVHKELAALTDRTTFFPLCQNITLENIENFSWDQIFEAVQLKAPILFNMLMAICLKKSEPIDTWRSRKSLKAKLGMALAILCNAKVDRKARFMPDLVSLQLYRGGLNRDMIKQLAKVGVCFSDVYIDKLVEKMKGECDFAKSNDISNQLVQNIDDETDKTEHFRADISGNISNSIPTPDNYDKQSNGDDDDGEESNGADDSDDNKEVTDDCEESNGDDDSDDNREINDVGVCKSFEDDDDGEMDTDNDGDWDDDEEMGTDNDGDWKDESENEHGGDVDLELECDNMSCGLDCGNLDCQLGMGHPCDN